MEKSLFALDPLNGETFEGYDTGDEWNGWAVPIFTHEQACRIVEAWNRAGWEARYDSTQDAFVFGVNHDFKTGQSDEFETFDAFERGGEKFYAVGSGAWIWEGAEIGAIANE